VQELALEAVRAGFNIDFIIFILHLMIVVRPSMATSASSVVTSTTIASSSAASVVPSLIVLHI